MCNEFDVADLVVKMDLKESKNHFRKREWIRRHQFLFVLLAGESHFGLEIDLYSQAIILIIIIIIIC